MAVNFEVLKGLLIRFVKFRIRNGDCTERQLARLIGTSQPQLHNVLKGARPLKQGLADALLNHFQISVLDLVNSCELCSGRYVDGAHDYFDRAEGARTSVPAPSEIARKPAVFEERRHVRERRAS
jgi:hypothetical protein